MILVVSVDVLFVSFLYISQSFIFLGQIKYFIMNYRIFRIFGQCIRFVKKIMSTAKMSNVNCYVPMNCTHYCILSIFRVINVFVASSLYSCETYKQVEEMVILHLFIEHHYKSIVSIIRERHVLTLHLSTANW